MKGFIAGATRGIGWAITEAVLHRLTELTILANDKERLDVVADKIRALNKGCKVEVISVDLADLDSLSRLLREWMAAEPQPRVLDFAVLNAGTYTDGNLAEIPIESYVRDLNINLNSHLVATQELLPAVRLGSRRRIFITGSTAAYEPYPLVPSYGIAKAGLRAFAGNLRVELAQERIGVSFIAPGGTLTDMWAGEDLPPRRLLEPKDIGVLVDACLSLSEQAVVEQLIVVPMEGDIHE